MFNKHFRLVLIIVTSLLTAGGLLGYFYHLNKAENSYLAHLSAVFIEIAISISLIEIFFEYTRRQASLKIYSLTRSYIFERVFNSLNQVIIKNQRDFGYIDQLGHYPSFHKKMKQNKVLGKLAEKILNNLSDSCLIEMARVIQRDFEQIEKSSHAHIIEMNEDLFISIFRFIDSCDQITKIELNEANQQFIIRSVRENLKLPNYDLSWRDIYLRVIFSWLYIINNYIYFSEKDSNLLRSQFKTLQQF